MQPPHSTHPSPITSHSALPRAFCWPRPRTGAWRRCLCGIRRPMSVESRQLGTTTWHDSQRFAAVPRVVLKAAWWTVWLLRASCMGGSPGHDLFRSPVACIRVITALHHPQLHFHTAFCACRFAPSHVAFLRRTQRAPARSPGGVRLALNSVHSLVTWLARLQGLSCCAACSSADST